jgi:signal transduction histidine kinase/CheY-like chemotaxis protein
VIRELVVPVLRDGKIVAILGVGNKAHDYGSDDVRDVAYLADVAWESVVHHRVQEKLTAEQRQNEQNLQRNQKLESLGVLAGGIAHDFNNLLHGLFNLMEIAGVQIGKGDPEKAARTLEAAKPVYERAKSLTRQFLTFSKGGAPVLKSLKLETLLRHGARFSLTGSAVTARVDIQQELWSCDADEHQIGQVLDNLILNARQAMGEAGMIEISASNQILDPPSGGARGPFVKISVRDRGCGIAAEQLSRIFDPFYTTKPNGHGLGLTMVHSIVKAHGGWVDVESELGKGSVFHVALPASVETPPLAEARGVRGPLRTGARVLILDDQDYARRVTRDILEELGHHVDEADHGQAALERIEEASRAGKPYQIAILDLTIPGGMGGREAAKAIRDLDPGVYLIAASGYSDHPVMSAPAAHGFDAALCKPFQAAELREALGKAEVSG